MKTISGGEQTGTVATFMLFCYVHMIVERTNVKFQ